MQNRCFATLALLPALLLAPATANAADDRVLVSPMPKRVLPAGVVSSCAADAKVSDRRQPTSRLCRLSPDSAVVLQATRHRPSPLPVKRATTGTSAVSVPQVSPRAARSPKRRRDGDAVAILGPATCPPGVPAVYRCFRAVSAEELFQSALVESPTAASIAILEQFQIPVFADVPPIVIINPDRAPRTGHPSAPPDSSPGFSLDGGALLP